MTTFNLREQLQSGVVCQKRTGRHKQFVIFNLLETDRLYKGPYTQDRLSTLLSRSKYFLQWQTPHMVLPRTDLILTDPTLPNDRNTFVTFSNLAEAYPVKLEQCVLNKESFSSYEYRVLVRAGLIKLSDALKLKGTTWLYELMPTLTIALLHCFILQVGDTHLANILVDVNKKCAYVIDFDETRSSDNLNDFFFLSKPPAKQFAPLWLDRVKENRSLLIQNLNSLSLSDPEMIKRKDLAISLLIHEVKDNKINIVTLESVTALTTPLTKAPLRLKISKEGNKGKMYWHGHQRGSVTYSGYAVDVVKSGLQKYIRRGLVEKAQMCGWDMYRLAEVGGVAVQTNLYTRLAIIACEDIGPANLSVVVKTLQVCLDNKREPQELLSLIELLANSPKTRLMSHLWTVFSLSMTDDKIKQRVESAGVQLDLIDIKEPTQILERFKTKLEQKDPICISWLSRYMQVTAGTKVPVQAYTFTHLTKRRRQTDPMTLIWNILKESLPELVWELLFNTYLEHTENRPFLMTALTTILYCNDMTVTPIKLTSAKILTEYNLSIDGYVIDKHTAEGRKEGKTSQDFKLEGAQVVNPDPNYFNQTYFDIYTSI